MPQQLTAAERETALLAAHGHSNKDIASNFILSVRTVENRLQRAYEKLDITSRGELADALGIAPEAESPRRLESARRALVGQ